MVERGWGRIVFISSESAINIPADMIHYGFTKTAQLAISRGLAKRLAGTGVTVNTVLPGPTLSEGVAEMRSLYSGQPWRQREEAVRTATFGAMTMILAAHAEGMGAGPMIGFDPEAVSREFGLASDEIPSCSWPWAMARRRTGRRSRGALSMKP